MSKQQSIDNLSKLAAVADNLKALQTIELGYGNSYFPFQFDPQQISVLVPPDYISHNSNVDLDSVLDNPIGSTTLEEIIAPSSRVVIVVPDATRVAGAELIAPLLLKRLNRHGLKDEQISILIGGGIHRRATDAEIKAIVGVEVATRLQVNCHQANDLHSLVYLGTTSRGTPVELNRQLVDTDHVIVIGAIGFHYLAGFSGGRKAILPGCAAERSIRANHLLSFDLNSLTKKPGVLSAHLAGNAVHEDMVEAVEMLNPSFLINTVINSADKIATAYAGHWREAHQKGCQEYKASHAITVPERRPLVIVSCGGSPRDINLIQSHKAMEHVAGVLEDGGTMVVLAECAEGLGRPDFMDWVVPGGSRGTALKLVDNYVINGQSVWGLRVKSERFRILLVSSLDADIVKKIGLEPHRSLESALAEIRPEAGYIVPGGTTTLPYVD